MNISKKTRNIIVTVSVIILVILLVFIVGNSFGFFKYIKKGDIVNIITIKGIEVEILNDEDDALNLENAYPISDSDGMLLTPFVFSMTNTSSSALTYSILIENDEEKLANCVLEDGSSCEELDISNIKYSYKKDDGSYSEPVLLSNDNNIIASGVINSDETIKSSIILWITSEAGNEIQNKYFFGKLVIQSEKYTTE